MSGDTRTSHALQHVNLLLVLFAGASLATGARLRWDPSAYVPLRELMETEYRVLAVAVPAAGVAMLLLSHLAIAAVAPAEPRRTLLYTYAGLMMVGIILELSLIGWVWSRAAAFSQTPEAEELEQILATREHLEPLLKHLARWYTISDHISAIMKEAEADVPWNGYVAGAAAGALLTLQMLGVVLALLSARPRARYSLAQTKDLSASRISLVDSLRSSLAGRGATPPTPVSVRSYRSIDDNSEQWSPLRAKYKNGRIVPLER